MSTPVDVELEELHFGLVEVVYEWARGTPFCDITGVCVCVCVCVRVCVSVLFIVLVAATRADTSSPDRCAGGLDCALHCPPRRDMPVRPG